MLKLNKNKQNKNKKISQLCVKKPLLILEQNCIAVKINQKKNVRKLLSHLPGLATEVSRF